MKNIRSLFLAIITIATISSCKKDEIKAPEFLKFELGYDNSGVAVVGSDLHMDAEIFAEGKVANVRVTIHHEGEHGEKTILDEEWEIDSTYTLNYAGAKNIDFHEHIEVDIHAEPGDYHFHISVTDMEGNRTEREAELLLMLPTDNSAPFVSISTAPSEGQVFTNGLAISVSGSIADDIALGGLYIGLVKVDQGLADAEVNATNTITMLHTHEFSTSLLHNFSASINVGAEHDNNVPAKDITGSIDWTSANYYILVKAKDVFGGNWGYSQRLPLQISL